MAAPIPRRTLATRTATLDIDAGENVVCTFTNTKSASLTVVKVTDPASDPQDFDFDLTGSGVPADLDLDTDAGDASCRRRTSSRSRRAQLGAHTVTESAHAGWKLTNLECTGGGADSSTSLANARRRSTSTRARRWSARSRTPSTRR